MTFLAARKAARILIRSLRHRHDLPLTRPAVSSRGGLTRHERAAEIEPKARPHPGNRSSLERKNSEVNATRRDGDQLSM